MNIELTLNALNSTKELIENMNFVEFIPYVCMVLEEYSKSNNLDVVELTKAILPLVQDVNAELGRY